MNGEEVEPRIKRWLRFLLGGGINTAFTYVVYLVLNLVMDYQLAYLLAYVMGIVFAYWFNAVFVFRVVLTWKGLFAYPIVYVVHYITSALFLWVLVSYANMSEELAPLLIVALLVPLTYILSKAMLTRKNNSKLDTKQDIVQDKH